MVLSGCLIASWFGSGSWQRSRPFKADSKRVWTIARAELVRAIPEHWKIDREDSDDGTLQTKWRVDNYIQDVTRRRVELEIESTDAGYVVKLRVPRERVFLSRDYDVGHADDADWETDGYDTETGARLLQAITVELMD